GGIRREPSCGLAPFITQAPHHRQEDRMLRRRPWLLLAAAALSFVTGREALANRCSDYVNLLILSCESNIAVAKSKCKEETVQRFKGNWDVYWEDGKLE